MALISAQRVREQWERMAGWPPSQTQGEVQGFGRRQPIATAYALASGDEEGPEATALLMQIAVTIDAVYRQVLPCPLPVTEEAMDAGHRAVEESFTNLIGVEPGLAMRRMLFQRDLAEPELLAELLRLMTEQDVDGSIESALGVVFMATKALVLAYERANSVGAESVPPGSLGQVLEAQLGHPLPKLARSRSDPPSSGQKFKKRLATEPPTLPERELSRAERLFVDYMEVVELTMAYFDVLCEEPDGRWLHKQYKKFEQRFHPGTPGGLPDALHVGYVLFDLQLRRSRQSAGQQLRTRESKTLPAPLLHILDHLCESYVMFHELIELRPHEGKKRLRELVTGVERLVNDPEDGVAELGGIGEVWFCRVAGPRNDAVLLGSPLLFQPAARQALDALVRGLLRVPSDAGPPAVDTLRRAMKEAVPVLAEYLLICGEEKREA